MVYSLPRAEFAEAAMWRALIWSGILAASLGVGCAMSGRPGGSRDGGTVKIFYQGTAPSTAGVQGGRLYTATY